MQDTRKKENTMKVDPLVLILKNRSIVDLVELVSESKIPSGNWKQISHCAVGGKAFFRVNGDSFKCQDFDDVSQAVEFYRLQKP